MEQSEFKTEIARLKKEYGDKAYGDERTNVLWAWAKKLSGKLFNLTVSEAIGNSSTAPLKNKLLEYYQEIRNKNPEIKSFPDCAYCGASGLVCDDQPLPTAYRWKCQAGQTLAGKVLLWPGEWKRMTPTTEEINWRQPAAIKQVVGETFKGPDKSEMKAQKDDAEKQISSEVVE